MLFHPDASTESATRRYKFEFTGLHFFNDFLACEMILNKTGFDVNQNEFNISVYFSSTMTFGSRTVDEYTQPVRSVAVKIDENSALSQRIRVFSTGIVKFDQLKGFITIKFPQNMVMGGEFIWSFADPAHSMVQLFLRFVFCILGIVIFIRLLLSDFDFNHSHIAMRLMFILDILLIIGSDPLYILTYFSDTYAIKLYDSLVGLLLLVFVAFTAFVVFLMSGLKHRDVSFKWIFVRFIPFLIAFIFFVASSGYAIMQVDDDPLSQIDSISTGLDTTRMIIIGIYFICLIYGLCVFQREVPNDKIFVIMSMVFFILIFSSELMNTIQPFLGSDFAIQIFTLAACTNHIIFFNFFNWPIDSSIILHNEMSDEIDKDQNIQVLSPTVVEI